MSVIWADGGGGVRKKVVVVDSLSEELVKESGRVNRTQGTSEPGMLDGNIHSDQRQFDLVWIGLAQLYRCICSNQRPAGQLKEIKQKVEKRTSVEVHLQDISTVLRPLLQRLVLFIYLIVRKRGFSHESLWNGIISW